MHKNKTGFFWPKTEFGCSSIREMKRSFLFVKKRSCRGTLREKKVFWHHTETLLQRFVSWKKSWQIWTIFLIELEVFAFIDLCNDQQKMHFCMAKKPGSVLRHLKVDLQTLWQFLECISKVLWTILLFLLWNHLLTL